MCDHVMRAAVTQTSRYVPISLAYKHALLLSMKTKKKNCEKKVSDLPLGGRLGQCGQIESDCVRSMYIGAGKCMMATSG